MFPIKEEKEKEDKEKEKEESKQNNSLNNNQNPEKINDNNNTNNKKDSQKEFDIDEEIEKERQKRLDKEKEKLEKKNMIKLLKLPRDQKTKEIIKSLKDYLSAHYDYFTNLAKQSEERFLKLIPLLKYETYKPNERIMNFGEVGDKCYILLQGSVGVYKPFPINKRMTLRDYVEYLAQLRDDKKNTAKFERILNYNSRIDKHKLYLIDFDYNKIPKYSSEISIVLEEERELAVAKAGTSFGEMSLIKNEPRNATIIALEKCSLISIEKIDYTKIVKDIEEQRIIKELVSFKEKYPLFKFWPSSKCFPLLSGLITTDFTFGEYVYKQNEFPTDIYLIKEGMFEVTTYFNFDTYENFIEYIHDSSHSLITLIDNPFEWKEDKISKRIEIAFQKNLSPFVINLNIEDKAILSHKEEENLNFKGDIAKNIEDELARNKNHVFKANIQKLYAPDIFGFVEALELKQRLCSIKCISQKGTLMKFPFREFLQLLPNDKRNNFYLQQRIYEEKKYIITQLKNNAMAKLNFVKLEIDKKLFIKKDFFRVKPKNKNLFELKQMNVNPNISLFLTPINGNSKLLNRSKSIYDISSINSSQKLLINESASKDDYISDEKINNLFQKQKKMKASRNNSFIQGFKISMLSLSRNKIREIKELYPVEEERLKPDLFSSNNIKEIDNSDNEYIKYLENNIQYGITPSRIRNKNFNDSNLLKGKRYTSLEADKIINKINREKKLRKITMEANQEHVLILPNVKTNIRNYGRNKSESVKIKKISFK